MGPKFRKTGIDFIGDVPWGRHSCLFYQTQEDLIDILVPYFKAGLESNEFCMWVTSEPFSEKGAKEAMRKAVPNFDHYLKKGQIEIVPHTEWYLKDGAFRLQRVLNAWIDKLNQALAKGYEGLRVTGNAAWLEKKDWRNFTDYEEQVNKVIGKYQMIAICTYSLNRCGASELLDVVKNHQFALIKREGKWELIESSERRRAEEALVKERNLLHLLMDSVPDWIFFKDAESRFIRINGALAQLLGIADSKEAVGKTDFDFFPQEDAQRFYEEEQKITQSGQPVVARVGQTPNRNGEILWVSETKMPLHDETGKVVGLVGICRDISALKRVEKELEESRSHFQTLFNVIADPVVIVDGKGEILEITDRVQETSGFKREELIGKNFLRMNLLTAKSKAIVIKNLAKRMMGIKIAPYEVEALTKDGKKIPYEVNAAKIEYMAKPVDMVVFRDLTERKKMDKALESEKKHLDALFKSIPQGTATQNLEHKIIEVNPAFTEMFGYTLEEIRGKNIDEIIAPREKLCEARKITQQYYEGKISIVETVRKRKDGSLIPVEITRSPIIVDNK